ncbi:MAG: sodium:calcium antiporter [Alphaproteobacteria bacterium]|nr:MAG: sodium:calcium antiporter [Alphaproteobacteria bacterium]
MGSMFTVLSLMGGLMFLAMGAFALIRGTAGFAHLAGVPLFLISLVVLGFGTSTPQLFTALQATYSGGGVEMALATAIGASIFNIFATLGVVALGGGAVKLDKRLWVRGSVALMFIAIVCAATLILFAGQQLPRWFGAIALLLLALYTAAAYVYERNHPTHIPMLKEIRKFPTPVLGGIFIAGLFGLVLGANLMVDAATQLSKTHELNPRFLGLTVLAIGTALPQLMGAFMAYADKQHTLILNNLIGNTIFNLLGVGGMLALLNPIQIQPGLIINSLVVLAAATFAFTIFTHPAMRRFKRAEGILFLLAYILYIGYLVHSL